MLTHDNDIDRAIKHSGSAIGKRLRSLRLRTGMTGQQLARQIYVSPSKVSKIEHGKLIPKQQEIVLIAQALQLDAVTIERLTRHLDDLLTLKASKRTKGTAAAIVSGGDMEILASNIDVSTPLCIPALLQIPSYFRAMRNTGPDAVALRKPDRELVRLLRRQALLLDSNKTYRFLLTQASLRSVFGSVEILHAQLRHLLTKFHNPSIQIGILPDSKPIKRFHIYTYVLMDSSTLLLEQISTDDVIHVADSTVREFAQSFEVAWSNAAKSKDARALIRLALDTLAHAESPDEREKTPSLDLRVTESSKA